MTDFPQIIQLEQIEVAKICRAQACYNRKTNTIYIPKIRGDWDHERIYALGHEMWHALGGRHE